MKLQVIVIGHRAYIIYSCDMCRMPYAVCRMPYAMPYALCRMPYALCKFYLIYGVVLLEATLIFEYRVLCVFEYRVLCTV
jgi:hypothetical protein